MFKSNLNRIMKAQKISGKEISLATGISESTISKFLSGNQEPKYSQIIKIARALNLPPEIFMSIVSSEFTSNSPIINEFYMIRSIYNEKYSNMVINTLHTFKEFSIDFSDIIDNEALYIAIIREGGVDSEVGKLRKGDYRLVRGKTIQNKKATVLKNTRAISFIIYDKGKSIPENWPHLIFDQLKPVGK